MLRQKRLDRSKINFDDLHMYCVQCWFLRSSWLEKLRVAKKFVDNTDDDNLQLFVNALTPDYIKDAVYSHSQTENNFTLDGVPRDDNRLLPLPILHSVQKDAVTWYTSLDRKNHITVILALIILGGPAFTSHLVCYMKTVLWNRWKSSVTAQQLSNMINTADLEPEPETTRESSPKKKKKKKGKKDSKISSASVKTAENRSLYRKTMTQSFEAEMFRGWSTSNISLNLELMDALEAWNKHIAQLKQQHGGEEEKPKLTTGKGKKRESKKEPDVVDNVQLLPLWINRRILSLLNPKDLPNLKKVNLYWSNMIDNLKKEQTARVAIDKCLAKMLNEKSAEMPETAKGKKKSVKSKRSQSVKTPKSSKKISRTAQVVKEDNNPPEPSGLPITADTSNPKDFSSVIFSRYLISTSFTGTQVSCINPAKQLLVLPDGNNIKFYSLHSGNVLPITFEGHTGRVTVVKFHPGGDLLSASSDKTIRRWSIWDHTPSVIYQGHTEPIIALCVTHKHLASAAQNSVIKVFHVDGGYCVWTTEWTSNIPIDLQMSDSGVLYVGSEQGFIGIYNIWKETLPKNVIAHKGIVNCLLLDGELLLSSGNDGYVRMWNCLDTETPMAALDHERKPVTCLCVFEKTLFCGCTNGSLYLWNLKTAERLRTFQLNFRELRAIHSFRDIDNIKVILNFDAQIQVLEFPVNEAHIRRRLCSDCKGVQSRKNYRIKSLATRCCADSSLKSNIKICKTIESVVIDIVKQKEILAKQLEMFPRYCPEQKYDERKDSSIGGRTHSKQSISSTQTMRTSYLSYS